MSVYTDVILIDAEEVRPGMIGEDYVQRQGTVLEILPIERYTEMLKYENSYWLNEPEFDIENNMTEGDYLVAVLLDSGEEAVYSYDFSGFFCVNSQVTQ